MATDNHLCCMRMALKLQGAERWRDLQPCVGDCKEGAFPSAILYKAVNVEVVSSEL